MKLRYLPDKFITVERMSLYPQSFPIHRIHFSTLRAENDLSKYAGGYKNKKTSAMSGGFFIHY